MHQPNHLSGHKKKYLNLWRKGGRRDSLAVSAVIRYHIDLGSHLAAGTHAPGAPQGHSALECVAILAVPAGHGCVVTAAGTGDAMTTTFAVIFMDSGVPTVSCPSPSVAILLTPAENNAP